MDELAGLSEEARRLALDRFRLLRPHLEQHESLTSVAKAAGIPYRTAHRLFLSIADTASPLWFAKGVWTVVSGGLFPLR